MLPRFFSGSPLPYCTAVVEVVPTGGKRLSDDAPLVERIAANHQSADRAAAEANDPTSHPADKLSVLQTAGEWHATYGYPGPAGPASDEVADNFVICDMMAKAATDKATPQEAVTWATKEVELIYKKWLS
jgi:hypothetical protein